MISINRGLRSAFSVLFHSWKSGKSTKMWRILPGFPLPQDLSLPCQVINFSAFFLAATHLQFFERFFVALKGDLSPLKKWFLRPQKHRQVTKIISKTLHLVGLRSLWLRFRKRQNMIDEGNKVAKLSKLLKWSHRSFISLRDLKKFLFQKVNYDFFWLSEKRESSWDFLALNNSKRSIKREKVREPGV